jgi:hypothetical protein
MADNIKYVIIVVGEKIKKTVGRPSSPQVFQGYCG